MTGLTGAALREVQDSEVGSGTVTEAEPAFGEAMTAALRELDGTLRASATPQLMQAYAVGR